MDFLFIYNPKGIDSAISGNALSESAKCWGDTITESTEKSILCFPEAFTSKCSFHNENYNAFIAGFVRDYRLPAGKSLHRHNYTFIQTLENGQWPLTHDWTGSFCSVVYNKKNDDIVIANDLIGYSPLYYTDKNGIFYAATNLILLNRIVKNEPDVAGMLPCISISEFHNFGARTIIQNIRRLLPGEYIIYKNGSLNSPEKKYDNTLYNNIQDGTVKDLARSVWDTIKEDSRRILQFEKELNVAQSGGMDSRLVLAAIPEEKKLHFLTYGSSEFYETQIASKLADARGAEFRNFPVEDYFFPEKGMVKKYLKRTDSLYVNFWMAIMENVHYHGDKMLIFGDMCEALEGVGLLAFSTRNARKRDFGKSFFNSRYDFTASTPEKMKAWQENKTKEAFSHFKYLERIKLSYNKADVEEAYRADLQEEYDLMEKINPPYTELYDELWMWHNRARISMGKQILNAKGNFFPVSTTMATKTLRATANIHPNFRLKYRIFNEIFSYPENRKIASIPRTQIPYVGFNSNAIVKEAIWGMRSFMDERNIKRIMKTQNPSLKYRFLPSINYVQLYQDMNARKHLSEWFSDKWLTGPVYLQIFDDRTNLKSKPVQNFNIVGPASVSLALDMMFEK